jgi:hypothetical protein
LLAVAVAQVVGKLLMVVEIGWVVVEVLVATALQLDCL